MWEDWFAGFSDGESTFHIESNGQPRFQIALRDDDRDVLEECRTRLGGKVRTYNRPNGNSYAIWVLASRDDLELVLSDVRGTGEPRPGDIPEGWSSARARLRAVLASPAVTGEQGDGQRQRNELLNTFAPTEPTVDDLPGSRIDGTLLHQLAVAVMTATTEAQEGMKPSDEALRHRDRLVRRVGMLLRSVTGPHSARCS